MKKIVTASVLIVFAALFLTCERNDLYNNEGDDTLALIMIDLADNSPQAIYIYDAGMVTGNLGGRAGADALCQAAAPPPFPITTVRAFISVSTTDRISSLVPSAYQGLPVYDYSGVNLISTSWTALWDGTIDMTLSAAGVLPGGLEWWTGSNIDGSLNAENCQGWTTDLAPDTGMRGNSNFPDAFWINWPASTCDFNNYILCVAY